MILYLHAIIQNLIEFFSILFAGFPEDGHKEKRRTVKTSKREIWHQHRPSKVTFWKPLIHSSLRPRSTPRQESFLSVQKSHDLWFILV